MKYESTPGLPFQCARFIPNEFEKTDVPADIFLRIETLRAFETNKNLREKMRPYRSIAHIPYFGRVLTHYRRVKYEQKALVYRAISIPWYVDTADGCAIGISHPKFISILYRHPFGIQNSNPGILEGYSSEMWIST